MNKETRRYIEWIRANLDRSKGKTQIGLARHLGLAHTQITMLMQGRRRLKVDEIPRIAEYLGVEVPAVDGLDGESKDLAEFIRLFPQASEDARQAALTTLRLGQKRLESQELQPAPEGPKPPKSR